MQKNALMRRRKAMIKRVDTIIRTNIQYQIAFLKWRL
jgi:hypothetical protein